MIALVMIAGGALFAGTPEGASQQKSLPAPQWMSNCIKGTDAQSDKGIPWTWYEKKPPTHDENVSYCAKLYRAYHPEEAR